MPTSATGSQAYIAMVKQDPATPRTIPPTPVMQKVNFDDEDLGTSITTKVSNHIRDDRMTADITTVGFAVGGGYNFEWQYENSFLDELLLGFLWAKEWLGGNIDIDIANGSFTQSGSILNFTSSIDYPELELGQWVSITKTAGGANDGIYQITEVTATNIYVVSPQPSNDETFPAGALANGSMARNGKFYQPFFIERGHLDVGEYFKFLGMACNVMSLVFSDQSDVTGSYQFVGLTSLVDQIVETGATYTPVTSNPVFSTVTNIKLITIDGVVQEGCFIKDMEVITDNKVKAKTGLGVLGACETPAHRLGVAGKLTMFFEDSAMYQRLLNGTPFSVSMGVMDAEGHGYIITIPRAKLDTDKINVTGVDDEVMDNASYVATADPVTGCMIQVDKF